MELDLSVGICFLSLHQVFTVDEDLVGIRARYLQVKPLSERKADREVHMADVVTDAMFHAMISVRFIRRRQSNERVSRTVLDLLLVSEAQQCY